MFFDSATGVWKIVLSIIFFPMFFQDAFLKYAWGAQDILWVMSLKRVFLLLPVLAIILACWASMASVLTSVFRQKRAEFIMAILVTWWDMGRSIFIFWGGIFKFLFYFVAALLALLKFIIIGIWTLVQDILLVPFRILKNIGSNVLSPGVPWIAVTLTVLWSILEACIFTYVTTPLVIDTLSNMTGNYISEAFIRIPLFFFLLIVILGSYTVLANWAHAIRQRNIPAILKISAIEAAVLFVEVMFLYREFVDSLMPWFAQHANFEPGLFGIIAIAVMSWFGVRGISWFLFAAHGTPTILAMIQGSGIAPSAPKEVDRVKAGLNITKGFIEQIRSEMGDIQKKGDEILGAFIVPPLQLIASAINFCTLCLSSQHLFDLPFKTFDEVMNSKMLLHGVSKKKIVSIDKDKD